MDKFHHSLHDGLQLAVVRTMTLDWKSSGDKIHIFAQLPKECNIDRRVESEVRDPQSPPVQCTKLIFMCALSLILG